MAQTNMKYIQERQQRGIGRGRNMEQMLAYKEQRDDDYESDESDLCRLDGQFDDIHKIIKEEENEEREVKTCNIKFSAINRQEKQRYLILKRRKEHRLKYARCELIYTKSPINIEVAVKSKFDEIKCICDLKQEVYEKLIELSGAYKHWI